MGLTKYKLRELLQLEDTRNSENKYSLEDVTGEGLAEQIKQEIIEYIDSNWDPQLSGGRMSFPRSSIAD